MRPLNSLTMMSLNSLTMMSLNTSPPSPLRDELGLDLQAVPVETLPGPRAIVGDHRLDGHVWPDSLDDAERILALVVHVQDKAALPLGETVLDLVDRRLDLGVGEQPDVAVRERGRQCVLGSGGHLYVSASGSTPATSPFS